MQNPEGAVALPFYRIVWSLGERKIAALLLVMNQSDGCSCGPEEDRSSHTVTGDQLQEEVQWGSYEGPAS